MSDKQTETTAQTETAESQTKGESKKQKEAKSRYLQIISAGAGGLLVHNLLALRALPEDLILFYFAFLGLVVWITYALSIEILKGID